MAPADCSNFLKLDFSGRDARRLLKTEPVSIWFLQGNNLSGFQRETRALNQGARQTVTYRDDAAAVIGICSPAGRGEATASEKSIMYRTVLGQNRQGVS